MKAKMLLAGGALFLSMVAVGSAKSWSISMDSAVKAGAVMLPAGDYSVKLHNDQAVFQKADTDKTYTVPVKVEKAQQKYDETAVETKNENGSQVIKSIDLGGTTDQLDFSE